MSQESREIAGRSRLPVEVAEINREFLNLLIHPDTRGAARVLSLEGAVVDGLRRLSASELQLIADAPLLLAEFDPFPGMAEVCDAARSEAVLNAHGERWRAELEGFCNRLVTCIWQTSRRDSLLTSLYVGVDRQCSRELARFSFRRISRCSAEAAGALRVRLADHERFWTDLVRLTRNGDGHQQVASRLSLIQLSVARKLTDAAHRPRYL